MINYQDPARGQKALGQAYGKALQVNANISVAIEEKDILIQEQAQEIARLTAKLNEAGIPLEDTPEEQPKPNRRTRRKAAAKTGNGAEAETASEEQPEAG